jgi:hypothetical protein
VLLCGITEAAEIKRMDRINALPSHQSTLEPAGAVAPAAGSAAASAADPLRGGEAAPLIFNQETCNSTGEGKKELDEVPPGFGIYQVKRGGRLDPMHGKGARIKDLKKIEALSKTMTKPLFVTLTLDREAWTTENMAQRVAAMSRGERKKFAATDRELAAMTPEEFSYRLAGLRVSRLFSQRLGMKVWVRVIEPQTKTGDGWMHWHCIVEAAGTTWCPDGRWVKLKELWEEMRRVWWDEWQFGRMVRVDLPKSCEKVAGYVAGYIVKGWPAIPPWLLESDKGFRLVGFSKAAGELVRTAMKIPPRLPIERTKPVKRRRHRAKLIDRLACSGESSAVFVEGVYVGTIEAPPNDVALVGVLGATPWLKTAVRTFQGYQGEVERLARFIDATVERGRELVALINSTLYDIGYIDEVRERVRYRREMFRHSWEMMQARAEMCF